MCDNVISASYFLARIGEPDERPRDREFCARLWSGEITISYREAEVAGDYDRMERLDREFNWLQCL